MKNLIKAIIIAVSLSVLSSWLKDDRNNYLTDESIYLLNNEFSQVDLNSGSCDINVIKSGKGLSECSVKIQLDEQALAEWNALNGENYLPLPENVLEFSATSLRFKKDDFRKTVTVTWEPAAVSALLSVGRYVIPVSLESSDLESVEGRSFVIVQPKL